MVDDLGPNVQVTPWKKITKSPKKHDLPMECEIFNQEGTKWNLSLA